MSLSPEELIALVGAARAGEDAAWARLVCAHDHLLRQIARGYRLGSADVDDVVQATWVRLHTGIAGVREPAAVTAWLVTTARRESLRVLRRQMREQLTDDADVFGGVSEGPEASYLAAESKAVLRCAVHSLPDPQRRLMSLLADEATPHYRHISAELDIPVGSIGPLRARGLARLRAHPALKALAG